MSHPFAFASGTLCCEYFTRKNDSSIDPLCDGGPLQIADPAACCPREALECSNSIYGCEDNPGAFSKWQLNTGMSVTSHFDEDVVRPELKSHTLMIDGQSQLWDFTVHTHLVWIAVKCPTSPSLFRIGSYGYILNGTLRNSNDADNFCIDNFDARLPRPKTSQDVTDIHIMFHATYGSNLVHHKLSYVYDVYHVKIWLSYLKTRHTTSVWPVTSFLRPQLTS